MNFIGSIESAQVPVELKYCERCGGLFVRPLASEAIYCGGCTAHLAAVTKAGDCVKPTRDQKIRNPRMVKGPKAPKNTLHGMGQIVHLQAVAAREVRA